MASSTESDISSFFKSVFKPIVKLFESEATPSGKGAWRSWRMAVACVWAGKPAPRWHARVLTLSCVGICRGVHGQLLLQAPGPIPQARPCRSPAGVSGHAAQVRGWVDDVVQTRACVRGCQGRSRRGGLRRRVSWARVSPHPRAMVSLPAASPAVTGRRRPRA